MMNRKMRTEPRDESTAGKYTWGLPFYTAGKYTWGLPFYKRLHAALK